MSHATDMVYPVRFSAEERKMLLELVEAYSSPVSKPSMAEIIKFSVAELYERTKGE